MSQKSKYKLVIFSDIHYAPEKPVNNGSVIDRKLTECALPIIEKLINKINNEIKPDVAINLGDLVEDFNDHDKDIINLNFIWNMLKDIEVPFYSLAGNHDLRSMSSRTEVEQIMEYEHSTFSVLIAGVVSAVLLFFTRPVAVKYFNRDRERTNAEALVGRQAIVISEIDNLQSTGQVTINGMEWTARTIADGQVIKPGEVVIIRGINGVKLLVEREESLS